MNDFQLLSMVNSRQAVHIAGDDMIHIIWKHATIRLNVTGLIYLVDYLNGERRSRRCGIDFQVTGSPDDGYQLWIQDVGLRLSPEQYEQFQQMLEDGLTMLRAAGKAPEAASLLRGLAMTKAQAFSPEAFDAN